VKGITLKHRHTFIVKICCLQYASCVISGFRHGVIEIVLLRCYAALHGSYLVTLRDSLSVPFSGIQKSKKTIKNGKANCPETSINIYQFTLRNIPEERGSLYATGFGWKDPLSSFRKIRNKIKKFYYVFYPTCEVSPFTLI
jgi:hypothetical protein